MLMHQDVKQVIIVWVALMQVSAADASKLADIYHKSECRLVYSYL